MRQPNSSSVQYYQKQGTGRLNTRNRDIKASAAIDPHRNRYIYIYIYRDPVKLKAQKKPSIAEFNSQ